MNRKTLIVALGALSLAVPALALAPGAAQAATAPQLTVNATVAPNYSANVAVSVSAPWQIDTAQSQPMGCRDTDGSVYWQWTGPASNIFRADDVARTQLNSSV